MMANLILWNDDFNSYDHVIQTLVLGLDKSFKESEFLTYLIHHLGSAIVKSHDDPIKLEISMNVLKENGLQVTIEGEKVNETSDD